MTEEQKEARKVFPSDIIDWQTVCDTIAMDGITLTEVIKVDPTFPQPIRAISCGSLWDMSEVLEWRRSKEEDSKFIQELEILTGAFQKLASERPPDRSNIERWYDQCGSWLERSREHFIGQSEEMAKNITIFEPLSDVPGLLDILFKLVDGNRYEIASNYSMNETPTITVLISERELILDLVDFELLNDFVNRRKGL